jgi:hypothetical protein
MIKQNFALISVAVFALLMSSCATVDLTTDGKKVRVLSPAEVSSCRELGKTNTSVTATALGVARPPETIKKELESIGRNSAANMGGDTVVPLTVIADGKQSFVVYKCVDPNS